MKKSYPLLTLCSSLMLFAACTPEQLTYPSSIELGDSNGMSVTSVQDTLRFDNNNIEIDVDGNGSADFTFVLEGQSAGAQRIDYFTRLKTSNAVNINYGNLDFEFIVIPNRVYTYDSTESKYIAYTNYQRQCDALPGYTVQSEQMELVRSGSAGELFSSQSSYQSSTVPTLIYGIWASQPPSIQHTQDTIFYTYHPSPSPPWSCRNDVFQFSETNYIGFTFESDGQERLGWIEMNANFGYYSEPAILRWAIQN